MCVLAEESPPKKRRLDSTQDSTEVILIGPQLEISPVPTVSSTSVVNSLTAFVSTSNEEATPNKRDPQVEPAATSSANKTSAAVPMASTSVVRIDDVQLAAPNSTSNPSPSTSDNEFKEENEFERKLLKKIELSVLMLLDYFKEEQTTTSNRILSLEETPPKPRNSAESTKSVDDSTSPNLLSSSNHSTSPSNHPVDHPVEATTSASVEPVETTISCANPDADGNV